MASRAVFASVYDEPVKLGPPVRLRPNPELARRLADAVDKREYESLGEQIRRLQARRRQLRKKMKEARDGR